MRWDALNFLPKIPCAIYEDIKKIARDAIESNVICAPSIFNKLGSFILSSLLHLLHLPLPMGLPTSLAARVDSFPVDMWVLGLTIAEFFLWWAFFERKEPKPYQIIEALLHEPPMPCEQTWDANILCGMWIGPTNNILPNNVIGEPKFLLYNWWALRIFLNQMFPPNGLWQCSTRSEKRSFFHFFCSIC